MDKSVLRGEGGSFQKITRTEDMTGVLQQTLLGLIWDSLWISLGQNPPVTTRGRRSSTGRDGEPSPSLVRRWTTVTPAHQNAWRVLCVVSGGRVSALENPYCIIGQITFTGNREHIFQKLKLLKEIQRIHCV